MYTLYRGTESVHCLVLVIIPLDDVEKTAFAFSYSGLLVVLCVCMSLMYTSKVHSTLPFEIYSTVCIYLSKKKKRKKKSLFLLPFFLSSFLSCIYSTRRCSARYCHQGVSFFLFFSFFLACRVRFFFLPSFTRCNLGFIFSSFFSPFFKSWKLHQCSSREPHHEILRFSSLPLSFLAPAKPWRERKKEGKKEKEIVEGTYSCTLRPNLWRVVRLVENCWAVCLPVFRRLSSLNNLNIPVNSNNQVSRFIPEIKSLSLKTNSNVQRRSKLVYYLILSNRHHVIHLNISK